MSELKTYWGDSHHNLFVISDKDVDVSAVCREARTHLDFFPLAYYTPLAVPFRPETNPPGKVGIKLEQWKDAAMLDREWAQIQQASRECNEEGAFVTFPGYEWQGDGTDGDHNVYHRREGYPIHVVQTLAELYQRLKNEPAYAIPHHTGYRAGHRGRDWSLCDERITPFTEIYSCHGCSETDEEWIGLRNNAPLSPGYAGGTYQDALNRGLHLGAICSTDNFGARRLSGMFGMGLMACLSPELTREAIWQAMGQRRVYGVTGDRILLDFTVNEAVMGSIIAARGKRRIRVNVVGQDAIDRIEILRNHRVMHTYCHQGQWDIPAPSQTRRFKVRVEAGWGPSFERLDVPDRRWRGELTLTAGRFVGWSPCWNTAGQSRPIVEGAKATIDMLSKSTGVRGRSQNANVFEMEAPASAVLGLTMNGLSLDTSLHALSLGSQGLYYGKECQAMLERIKGLPPDFPKRHDIFYDMAYKVKVHKAIPQEGYTASVEIEDDAPFQGEIHYRIRVEQRNGQRAWSSPIWVHG